MAFDEALAHRIRDVLSARDGVSERKMFGGIAGRPSKNMVYVDPGGTASDADLANWVEAGAAHAASSPQRRNRGRTGGACRLSLAMREESDTRDVGAARIAGRQHGVVTFEQLRRVGIDRNGVARRVRAGRLHRIHRGVYAVGHRGLSPEGRWMAAVLACGDGAVLSHRSAAVLWEMLRPMAGPLDVSVPSRVGRKRRAGIALHRCASLSASGSRGAPPLVTEHKGIPVTSPARTIEDLRGVVPPYLVRRATRQAEFAKLIDSAGSDRTRSDLEGDFRQLCRAHGIPAPEVNIKVGNLTVDFLWRQERIAVETDSYRYHRGQVAFQDDRARDLELRRHGLEVRRYSELQVNESPGEVMADLREALGNAAKAGRPQIRGTPAR